MCGGFITGRRDVQQAVAGLQRSRLVSAFHRQRALAFGWLSLGDDRGRQHGVQRLQRSGIQLFGGGDRRLRRFVAGGGRLALDALRRKRVGCGCRGLQQAAALAEGGQQLIERVAAQGRGAFIVRAQRDRRLFAASGGCETGAEQLGESGRQLALIQRRRQFGQAAGVAG
ncbi:hypothetical protein M8494_06690 [Serratia ureilytica]